MSLTATTTKTPRRNRNIILSPSKRRRLSGENNLAKGPSSKEIWEWTLTSASVAKCYVRDVLIMPESQNKEGYDFYWLGSVPCRKVEIYAIVVGIQVFEKKVLYTVDDGTAVVECKYVPQPPRPQISSKYERPPEPPPLLKPMARIGQVVKVIGKVQQKYETAVVLVDEISVSSLQKQLGHWKKVRELHNVHYSCPGPFTIPVLNFRESSPHSAQREISDPPTPSTIASTPTTVASSPIKPSIEPQSPPKLRHPSRLRSHNLTDATFRLYVKHFIDNSPEDRATTEDVDELAIYLPPSGLGSDNLLTPTKVRKYDHDDRTPRPNTSRTSRPTHSKPVDGRCKGFTLSYLRRIPELSLMAKRVVKQRIREADKKSRESASQLQSNTVKRTKLDRKGLQLKKKRLFQWAICELLREGSIVLWDGPNRPCPEENTYGNRNASVLWKYSSSATQDTSLFSNAGTTNQTFDDEDELELSDPEPQEEGYISTKPELLSPIVESTLKKLASVPRKQILKRNELTGGFTKEEISEYLRKDDRWAFIGEWNISEALEYMEKEGLVWCLGSDKWYLMQ